MSASGLTCSWMPDCAPLWTTSAGELCNPPSSAAYVSGLCRGSECRATWSGSSNVKITVK